MRHLRNSAEMSRTRRAAMGGIVSLLQVATQMALQALLYPLFLRAAGAETLGAYSMLQQALGYFALSDLGFGSALGRWLAQAASEGPTSPRFLRLVRAGRTLQLGSGLFYAVLCLSLLPFLGLQRLHLPSSAHEDAKHALIAMALWSLVRAPATLAFPALQALQRLAEVNLINLLGSVARLGVSIALTLHGWGILGLALATIAGELTSLLCASILLASIARAPGPSFELPERSLVRELSSFGLRALGMSVGVKLIFATDSVIVGALHGAAAAGAYYATQIPALFCITALWTLQDNTVPALNELISRRESAGLRRVFLQLMELTLILAGPFAIGVALFNRQLISLWMGAAQYSGDLLTYSLAAFAFFAVVQHLQTLVLYALGDLRVLTWLVALEGALNLGMSVGLGIALGPGGVMLASLIATLPTVVWVTQHLLRHFEIGFSEAARVLLRPALLTSGSALAGGLLGRALDPAHPWAGIVGHLIFGGATALVVSGDLLRARLATLRPRKDVA